MAEYTDTTTHIRACSRSTETFTESYESLSFSCDWFLFIFQWIFIPFVFATPFSLSRSFFISFTLSVSLCFLSKSRFIYFQSSVVPYLTLCVTESFAYEWHSWLSSDVISSYWFHSTPALSLHYSFAAFSFHSLKRKQKKKLKLV